MNVTNRATFALAATLLAVVANHANAQERIKSGSDAQHPTPEVNGYVIRTSGNELRAISLPSVEETLVRRLADDDAKVYPRVHALSGPDSKGRIAYIEDHLFVVDEADRKHLLKTVNVDGTQDEALFSRPGSAMWAASPAGRGEIGTYLALAPTGGKLALLTGLSARQMPRVLHHEGDIEIWDIDTKRRAGVTSKAINQPMSWFPDGRRLAYSRLVPRDELPLSAIGLDRFGTYFGESWEHVPAIYVLDTQTGATSFLHVGWTPVVCLDGKAVLVGGWDHRSEPPFSWSWYDIEASTSAGVTWPGDAGGAIAAPTANIVLYMGTTDEVVNPVAPYSLKLAVLDSAEHRTIRTEIAPRTLFSFGMPHVGK